MIVQKPGISARIEIMGSGRIVRYECYGGRDLALLSGKPIEIYSDMESLFIKGWKLCPLEPNDFTEASIGEVVVYKNGNERMILGASGVGARRIYNLSSIGEFDETGHDSTAAELGKITGTTLKSLVEEKKEPRKMTVAEVAKEIGEEVEIIKG